MVLLWSGEDSWEKPYRTIEAYPVPVSALAWMGHQLITAGQNSQVFVYDCDDEDKERRLLTGNDAPVTSLSVLVSSAGVEEGYGGERYGQTLLGETDRVRRAHIWCI